jgi:hypothetical protein
MTYVIVFLVMTVTLIIQEYDLYVEVMMLIENMIIAIIILDNNRDTPGN